MKDYLFNFTFIHTIFVLLVEFGRLNIGLSVVLAFMLFFGLEETGRVRGQDVGFAIPFERSMAPDLKDAVELLKNHEVKRATRLLDKINNSGEVADDVRLFFEAALQFEAGNNLIALRHCETLLARAPKALQAADLMCFSASLHNVSLSERIASIKQSVDTQEKAQLLQSDRRLKSPDNRGRMLANSLIARFPNLTVTGTPGKQIEDWLAHLLSGKDADIPIHLASEHNPEWPGSHHYFEANWSSAVLFLDARDGGCKQEGELDEPLLAMLIFELMNLENWREFRKLRQAAMVGTVCKDEFVVACAKLEHLAILKLRQFYVNHLLPTLLQCDIKTDPIHWRLATAGQFNTYMAMFSPKDLYPWKYYEKAYDRLAENGYWLLAEPEDDK